MDTISPGAELSPTLAATILNWQQFNKDLVMMNNHAPACKSDGELEVEGMIFVDYFL